MAMVVVSGKTQDKWMSFYICSQMTVLELGSPSDAVVTQAGPALPAWSLILSPMKQHKSQEFLPLLLDPVATFPVLQEFPFMLCLVYGTFPSTYPTSTNTPSIGIPGEQIGPNIKLSSEPSEII